MIAMLVWMRNNPIASGIWALGPPVGGAVWSGLGGSMSPGGGLWEESACPCSQIVLYFKFAFEDESAQIPDKSLLIS